MDESRIRFALAARASHRASLHTEIARGHTADAISLREVGESFHAQCSEDLAAEHLRTSGIWAEQAQGNELLGRLLAAKEKAEKQTRRAG